MNERYEKARLLRIDFYVKSILLALLNPFGFSVKDIDTPVTIQSKRKFILDLERAGFVSCQGGRRFGNWTFSPQLMKMATKHILDSPIVIPNLCELTLKLHPSSKQKAELMRNMLNELKRGSMADAQRSMVNYTPRSGSTSAPA